MGAELLQPGKRTTFANGIQTTVEEYAGPSNDISTLYTQNLPADISASLSSGIVNMEMTNIEGTCARLTITRQEDIFGDTSSDARVLADIWEYTTAQYQYPLYKYCSKDGTGGAIGNSGTLYAWENKPTDDEHPNDRNDYVYNRKPDGTEEILDSSTQKIAAKMLAGTDTVMRYFPNVVRRRTFSSNDALLSSFPSEISARNYGLVTKVGQIDNTPSLFGLKFGGISWLKTQFDIQIDKKSSAIEQPTLTEGWIGILSSDVGGWDKNLYGTYGGTDRWAFYKG